ncbi:hypothetical protein GW17_00046960 [Ensete ventricosum]|nr:hypothetical protein GW17_00046960 [Ensete ventricosum]
MASPSRPTRVSSPLLLGLGFLIALIAFALQFYIRKHLRPRLWTVEELTLYNGTEDALPILLGILGYSKILLYALTSYHLLVSLVRLICERKLTLFFVAVQCLMSQKEKHIMVLEEVTIILLAGLCIS